MSVYIDLADHISLIYNLKLPPHNEDSPFVKIFRRLLTQKEAELLMSLDLKLRSPGELSAETGLTEGELSDLLYRVARKGIIAECSSDSGDTYRLLPFMPGIFESLGKEANHPEIARYLDDYTKELSALKAHRDDKVIHMNQKIEILTESMTIREIESYLRRNDRYVVMDCICRSVQAVNGNACGHSIKDMCIVTGEYVDYYIRIENAREVTLDQVLEILHRAEDEGLIHEVYPIEGSHSYFICNCCSCGCMFLQLSDRIKKVIRYNTRVNIDHEKCIRCGKCIESCPYQVLHNSRDGSRIEAEETLCEQCGLCSLVCPVQAITVM